MTAAAAAPSTTASPAPAAIFDRTFARLFSYPVPPYSVLLVTRRTRTTVSGRVTNDTALVRYAFRTADGAQTFSGLPIRGTRLPQAIVAQTFGGPFAWTLRTNASPGIAAKRALLPDLPTPLPVIAHVITFARQDYTIYDDGVETIGGHRVYHLHLRALSDPARHNLRDLWVDTSTFDLWKARFTGFYAPLPWQMESSSTATDFFEPMGPYWVAVRWIWTYDDVDMQAHQVYDANIDLAAFPRGLLGWLFDQRAYDRHRRAGSPDLLAPYLEPSPSPVP